MPPRPAGRSRRGRIRSGPLTTDSGVGTWRARGRGTVAQGGWPSIAIALDEPVIIPTGSGMARFIGDERGTLLHALEDHDDASVSVDRPVVGGEHLLLADTLGRRRQRRPTRSAIPRAIPLGQALQPPAIAAGTPCQHRRRDPRVAANVAEEVDDVLRPLQPRVVAAQHDAVPASVAELDEVPEDVQKRPMKPALSRCLGIAHTNLPRRTGFMSAPDAHHRPSRTVSVTNRCWPPAAFRFTWLLLVAKFTNFPKKIPETLRAIIV